MTKDREITPTSQPPSQSSGIDIHVGMGFLEKLLASASASQLTFFGFLFWLICIAFWYQAGAGYTLLPPPQPLDNFGRIAYLTVGALAFWAGVRLSKQTAVKQVEQADEQKAVLLIAEMIAKERNNASIEISEQIIKAIEELYATKKEVGTIDVYRKLVAKGIIKNEHYVEFSEKMLEEDKSF